MIGGHLPAHEPLDENRVVARGPRVSVVIAYDTHLQPAQPQQVEREDDHHKHARPELVRLLQIRMNAVFGGGAQVDERVVVSEGGLQHDRRVGILLARAHRCPKVEGLLGHRRTRAQGHVCDAAHQTS